MGTSPNSLAEQIQTSQAFLPHIHSLKTRMKDPKHLRDKLERKLRECKKNGKAFTISKANLFMRVNDLAGLRILHVHTQQAGPIIEALLALFAEEVYSVVEGPTARTWDDESRAFFRRLNIKTKKSPSLYTSIHFVIKPNKRTRYTCEIQLRTLMEEVWGEVDHSINYPYKSQSTACREQIAALARVTSACSRLVDSIFRSHEAVPKDPPRRRAHASAQGAGKPAH